MASEIYNEAEIPGREVSQEQFNMVCCRYNAAIPFIENKNVLEIGCGAGLGLGLLSKRAKCVIAGDLNEKLLKMVHETYGNKIKVGVLNAHCLHFDNSSFDVILSMEVLQYLSIETFLKECKRTLKTNGKLIICIPNPDNIDFKPSSLSCDYFSVSELKKAFIDNGFLPAIYGAFESKNSNVKGIKQNSCEVCGAILNYFPLGEFIKRNLNKNLLHKVKLPAEITEMHIKPELLKLVKLDSNKNDVKYKIIYVIAEVVN